METLKNPINDQTFENLPRANSIMAHGFDSISKRQLAGFSKIEDIKVITGERRYGKIIMPVAFESFDGLSER